MDVINKITSYMLNLLYHLDNNKNGNNLGQKDKNENEGDNNDEENIIKNYSKEEKDLKEFEENVEVSDDKENDDDNVLKTDIFYPQKNIKKKGKRNYNDMIGEKNELKIFKEKLLFNSKSKK